ncbi:MAG: hypothetical protein ACW97O_17940, partial [Candidatus Thorarchaeota archaeon]
MAAMLVLSVACQSRPEQTRPLSIQPSQSINEMPTTHLQTRTITSATLTQLIATSEPPAIPFIVTDLPYETIRSEGSLTLFESQVLSPNFTPDPVFN